MRTTIEKLKDVFSRGSGVENWSVPEAPATDAEIRDAEAALKRKLPSDLVELLRWSRCWSWREKGFDAVIFFPPGEIVEESTIPEEDYSQIAVSTSKSSRARAIYYSDKRTTFAVSDYFRFQIDEDPGDGGAVGQIVVIDFEEETIDVIAESLEAFVQRGIQCLERQIAGGYPNDEM